MASLVEARNALAAQIQNYVQPVIPTVLSDPMDQVPNVPAAMVFPGKPVAKYGITLGEAGVMGGRMMAATEFNLQVLVLVSQGSTIERVQTNLDSWLGFENFPGNVSIPAAVALDPTLGMAVDYCEASIVSSYGPIEYNGTTYFGARIDFSLSCQ